MTNLAESSYADVLFEAKRGFVIIGLTGYTGSGCTTTARILGKAEKFSLPQNYGAALEENGQQYGTKQFLKLQNAWNNMEWKPYTQIEVGAIILGIIINRFLCGKLSNGLPPALKKMAEDNKASLSGLENFFKAPPIDVPDCVKLITAYELCVKFQTEIKKSEDFKLGEYIAFMQLAGDKIRLFGELDGVTPDPKNMLIIPEAIRKVISAYKKSQRKSRFVIDAFRNPFEVEYFKRRYAEFYLICIMRDQEERAASLKKSMPWPDIEKIWEKEKGETPTGGYTAEEKPKNHENLGWWVTGQNIPACAQKADIYIKPKTKSHTHLNYHLARVLSLIFKPGLLTPNNDEYNMQIAATSRHMSGCLSRQVGAVVVGKDGYLLGLGWNDPPQGQVPCSLRSCGELLNTVDIGEGTYSAFEQGDRFKTHIREKASPANSPFCFRSELASMENGKRAEYTRALHAEENAFLQVSKNGGISLRGSTLYTTASTCTLCAKKAYQLEVDRIVFIELYPDYAHQQTILSGSRKISYDQFEGISGNAFFRLFAPIMPEKDLVDYYY